MRTETNNAIEREMSKVTIVNKRGLVAAVLLSAFFGFAFAIVGGFHSGFSAANLWFFGAAGAILGMIGAPALEPKIFRYPTLWQILFAISGPTLLAASLSAPAEGYGLAALGGVILGYLAPYWVKHIQVP